jgi:hypothetical protein
MLANQSDATKRRVYFDLRETDGLTPALDEAGGQPYRTVDTAGTLSWTTTGIGTLTAIGFGRYYAVLTQAAIATAGTVVETRYKSDNTVDCPGDTVQVVAFDPDNADTLGLDLPNQVNELLVTEHGAGEWGSIIEGTGSNTVIIEVVDPDGVPIPALLVTVKDATETNLRGGPQPTTTSGTVTFGLAAGSYRVLIESDPSWQAFATQDLTVASSGVTTETYTLTPQTSVSSPSLPTQILPPPSQDLFVHGRY